MVDMSTNPYEVGPMTVGDFVSQLLTEIEAADTAGAYEERNRHVYELLAVAAQSGWPHGIRIDPADPEWPVVYVELPVAGQVSWHVPQYADPWDGHTTDEKYERAARYGASLPLAA